MLEDIIDRPELNKYRVTYEPGKIIFLEGDDSQDLFFLISGQVDVLKGDKKFLEVTEKGSIFGEMSFLLGTRRTASVKAASHVDAICIPKDEITALLEEFPAIAKEITRHLATRLDETSQVVYGLKEISDKLPDAVIVVDKDEKIISWNKAAQGVYGWDWHQMSLKRVEDIYEDLETYRDYIREVQEKHTIREKVLKVHHPGTGTRFVSTSATVLYDGHHNYQGVLALGRDVTSVQHLEKKYRKVRNGLLAFILFLGILAVVAFISYPRFSRDSQTMDIKKQALKNQLGKDYLMLKSLLAEPLNRRDREELTKVVKDFFSIQGKDEALYLGLILLDKDKKVFYAYSEKTGTKTDVALGSNYGSISFRGTEKSLHRVLILYRIDKDHPMGQKGIEVAFPIRKDSQFLGWILFQMNTELLKRNYDLDEEGIERFQF